MEVEEDVSIRVARIVPQVHRRCSVNGMVAATDVTMPVAINPAKEGAFTLLQRSLQLH